MTAPFPGYLTPAQILAQAQAQVNAGYDPTVAAYQGFISDEQAASDRKIALLRAIIGQAVQGLQGLPAQVQQAYRNAATDQGTIAQGFSGALAQTLQGEADKSNALLAAIGAPAGQNIPGSQATDVGNVAYGLGGYLNASSIEAQGLQAFKQAQQLPAQLWSQGLGLISQYQTDATDRETQYRQQIAILAAQHPSEIQKAVSDIQAQQAQMLKDGQATQQQVYANNLKLADSLTSATGYLYVVTKDGTLRRATDSAGKPILTLAGQKAAQTAGGAAAGPPKTITGPDGLYAWNATAGGGWQLVPVGPRKTAASKPPGTVSGPDGLYAWQQTKTGWNLVPIGPRNPATPPSTISGPDGLYAWQQTKTGWTLAPIGPREPVTAKPPATVSGPDGLYAWQQTKTGWNLVPVGPRKSAATTPKPPDTFSSNGQRYAWSLNKYGNWIPVPIGLPPKGKPKFTPIEISRFKSTAADSAYDAFWGVKDQTGKLVQPPKHYQEAMSDLLAHGIPLDVAQAALNQFWKRPGYDADIANRQNGKIVWFHSGSGRPVKPFQARGKGSAAAETAAPSGASRTTDRASGGQYVPVPTPLPPGSEFATVDAEGAPDANGVTHHAAKDWFAPAGTAVSSPIPGRIVEVKPSVGTSGQIFGGVVKVQGANGRVWVFRHVDPGNFKVGDPVKGGQVIATVSRWNDNPNATHTHIELWKTLAGGYHYENMIDPIRIFAPGKYPASGATAESPSQPSNDVKMAKTPSGARAVGKRMAALRGWRAKQWTALNTLINSESGWNYRAWHNPGTGRPDTWRGAAPPPHGAFGIGQALGHELPGDYATNPVTQITWMLDYIAQRYGTPQAALQFKLAHGGLNGGWY